MREPVTWSEQQVGSPRFFYVVNSLIGEHKHGNKKTAEMTQNYLQSISFYDLLTKITCGFLLELPLVVMSWEVITQSNFVIFLLLLFSYPLGLALEIVSVVISGKYSPKDAKCSDGLQRRSPNLLELTHQMVYGGNKKAHQVQGGEKYQKTYDEAWYRVYSQEKALSDIDIMEAQLAFMKVAIIPLIVLIVICFIGVFGGFNTLCKGFFTNIVQYYIIIGYLIFTLVSYIFLIPTKQFSIYRNVFSLERYSKKEKYYGKSNNLERSQSNG